MIQWFDASTYSEYNVVLHYNVHKKVKIDAIC